MKPNAPLEKPAKRFLSDREIELYGWGEAKLKRMRLLVVGPEFRRFGHKTVLYDVRLLEEWIARNSHVAANESREGQVSRPCPSSRSTSPFSIPPCG